MMRRWRRHSWRRVHIVDNVELVSCPIQFLTMPESPVGRASTPARDVHVPQKPDQEVRRGPGEPPHPAMRDQPLRWDRTLDKP